MYEGDWYDKNKPKPETKFIGGINDWKKLES